MSSIHTLLCTRGDFPRNCPHCGFYDWHWKEEKHCPRCGKDRDSKPDDEYETVNINGRMVKRRKQK